MSIEEFSYLMPYRSIARFHRHRDRFLNQGKYMTTVPRDSGQWNYKRLMWHDYAATKGEPKLSAVLLIILITLAVCTLPMWILYFVIKCAIRDGIIEADQKLTREAPPNQANNTRNTDMPDMRADR